MTYPIKEQIFTLLQQCDEIGGLEDQEYIDIMVEISEHTRESVANAAANFSLSDPLIKSKIAECPLFYTPKSMKDFEAVLDRYNGTEKALVTSGAMFGWNLACHLVNGDE